MSELDADPLTDEAPAGARVVTNAPTEEVPGRDETPTGARVVTNAPTERQPTGEPHAARADHIGRVAKMRCLDQVKARGFTFAKGKVVEGVPLAHAEYLAAGGKAEILEVS